MAKTDDGFPHGTRRQDILRRGGVPPRLIRKGSVVLNNLGLSVVDEKGDRRVAVGNIGGRPWGDGKLVEGTHGIWGDAAGLYLRGYARLLGWGYAEDEEQIDLRGDPNLADPKILVAPKEMLTFSPQHPNTAPVLHTEAIQEEPGLFRVKAKTRIKGAFTAWPGGWTSGGPRAGTWEQPQVAGPDGRRGVPTNFIQCRVYWFASIAYVIHIRQWITNEFNANGQPINWKNVRYFRHQGPLFGAHSGTLNWDLSLQDDVWAVRVTWDGGNPPLATYATAEVRTSPAPGYRTDAYLNVDGVLIGPDEPSGMSVMYIAYDQG